MSGYAIKNNSSTYDIVFFMRDSSDHVTGKTGLSPTVTIRKQGGSFASPSGAVTEIASGWYKVAGNSTDSNTLGPLLFHATGTGADPTDATFLVVAYDPFSATNLGLSNLDTAVSGVAAAVWAVATAALTAVGSIGKLLVDNVNATISSRSTYAGGDTAGVTTLLSRVTTAVPTATEISNTVWAAGSRTLTSMGSLVSDIWSNPTRTLSSFGTLVADIWAAATSGLTTVGSIGKLLVDNVNATISSRSTYAGTDTPGTTTLLSRITTAMPTATEISNTVWAAGSRTLTSMGSLVSDIWSNPTRTLSSFGTLVADVWANATRSLTDKAGFAPDAATVAAATLGSGPKSLQAVIELATDAQVNDAGTLITIVIDGETITYVRTPGPAVPPAKRVTPSE